MSKLIFAILFLLAIAANAETVTTTDGRTILLNADGTYSFLGEIQNTDIPLEEQGAFTEVFNGEYGQNSVRFMPIFKNVSDEAIVGFKFTSIFKSAFGDSIYEFSGESTERIPAGSSSTADTFYIFEDNQFIAGQPYDKLKIFILTDTGKIETKIDAVVFDGGRILTFNRRQP